MKPRTKLPDSILEAGRLVFSDENSLREWLKTPARWAEGRTPEHLIDDGKSSEVVDALTALAFGHFI